MRLHKRARAVPVSRAWARKKMVVMVITATKLTMLAAHVDA
jgi:hypothetical protein